MAARQPLLASREWRFGSGVSGCALRVRYAFTDVEIVLVSAKERYVLDPQDLGLCLKFYRVLRKGLSQDAKTLFWLNARTTASFYSPGVQERILLSNQGAEVQRCSLPGPRDVTRLFRLNPGQSVEFLNALPAVLDYAETLASSAESVYDLVGIVVEMVQGHVNLQQQDRSTCENERFEDAMTAVELFVPEEQVHKIFRSRSAFSDVFDFRSLLRSVQSQRRVLFNRVLF